MENTHNKRRDKLSKLFLGTSVIFSLFSCKNDFIDNDLTNENLKGKVKSYTQFVYEAIDRFGEIKKGEIRGGVSQNESRKYNKDGNKTEITHYNVDGSSDYKFIYLFDEIENIKSTLTFDSEGELKRKTLQKYGENRNLIEVEESKYSRLLGSEKTRTIFKYDNKNNCIEESEYNSSGVLKTKIICKNDHKGNRVEEKKYSGDGKTMGTKIYQYDSNRNIIIEDTYISKGSLPNQVRSRVLKDSIEILNYSDDKYHRYRYVFNYNENGDMIEESFHESDGSIAWKYIYKYKYDKKGNWIEMIGIRNEIPKYIIVREYEYY